MLEIDEACLAGEGKKKTTEVNGEDGGILIGHVGQVLDGIDPGPLSSVCAKVGLTCRKRERESASLPPLSALVRSSPSVCSGPCACERTTEEE